MARPVGGNSAYLKGSVFDNSRTINAIMSFAGFPDDGAISSRLSPPSLVTIVMRAT